MSEESEDARLIERCRAGESSAWGALVHRYKRLIYTIPRRAGLDEYAAADVFQATFSTLLESLDRLDDPAKIRAWLVTTSMRETLKVLKQHRRDRHATSNDGNDEDEDAFEIADESPLPEELLSGLQDEHRIRAAFSSLDEQSRSILEAFFLRDPPLTYGEYAQQHGISIGSIGPTRARALAKLRSFFDKT